MVDSSLTKSSDLRALVLCDGLSEQLQRIKSRCPGLQHQTLKTFVSQYRQFAGARWPLVMVVDLSHEVLDQDGLLACIRDCAADRVLLWNEQALLADLLAMGFRRFEDTADTFVFDLYDYKKRPDWFNADNFAHPHRWNSPD